MFIFVVVVAAVIATWLFSLHLSLADCVLQLLFFAYQVCVHFIIYYCFEAANEPIIYTVHVEDLMIDNNFVVLLSNTCA